MKKLIILSILSAFAANSKAQNIPTALVRNAYFKKMIHANPISLIAGGMELAYESAVTNKQSFYTQVGYYTSAAAGALDIGGDEYKDMDGVKVELQYRFYRKTNNYIKNVFITPFLNFKTLTATKTTLVYNSSPNVSTMLKEKQNATTISVGYMMGIRKSIFENIYMDLSIGGGVFIPIMGDNHEAFNIPLVNPYQRGVQFKANLGLCMAL